MNPKTIITPFLLFLASVSFSQELSIRSPNESIEVGLHKEQANNGIRWFLNLEYQGQGEHSEVIPRIDLGLIREDQDFSKNLKLLRASDPVQINESYTALHGKRKYSNNSGNEILISFENAEKAKLNLIVRAYNDGVTFRYEFPEKQGTVVVKEELTSYTIKEGTKRWMEEWNPANERLYSVMDNGEIQQDWCYPALFTPVDQSCWFLIHESDVDRNYCGTKLSNQDDGAHYRLVFPDAGDGRGLGESQPTISLPWKSPWRVIIVGSLADIVESTLVDDVATPSKISNTDWIQPGVASWNYWSNNHGTKDFKVVCEFADLAASMGWPYTLLDWEWDAMANGGNLDDAINYIHSLGVKPLIWYNSGGPHTWVSATPQDRMLTHENRVEEFSKLQKLGIVGVKVDFFESEKQDMISYYLDILEDAAQFEMMVYFHGCLVPRGWARTYPNLMTYEGVRGAEWYNNGPELTTAAPEHNSILPYTRNVIGSMDYTPVTFTNSQHPHITSYGHELALSVVFESGIQHFADRPEGYYQLPDAAKDFMKTVPNAWENTRYLDGYPGKDVMIARQKGTRWYIGAINGEAQEKLKTLSFDFLPAGVSYRLTLIADGTHDKSFNTQFLVVDKTSSIQVKLLRRGGFAALLEPSKTTGKN